THYCALSLHDALPISTIRNVSRGIIGIAILQALLAGIGLLFAGIPAAGLFSFLVLLFGILQIGPSIILIPLIIWSWFTMDTTMRSEEHTSELQSRFDL